MSSESKPRSMVNKIPEFSPLRLFNEKTGDAQQRLRDVAVPAVHMMEKVEDLCDDLHEGGANWPAFSGNLPAGHQPRRTKQSSKLPSCDEGSKVTAEVTGVVIGASLEEGLAYTIPASEQSSPAHAHHAAEAPALKETQVTLDSDFQVPL